MIPKLRLVRPEPKAPPSADLAEDAELVHRLVGGDPRAAVLLWRRHAVMVRGLVVRSLGPGVDVEDLVQDTFAVFFRKLRTLKDPAAMRSFLIGITIREIKSEIRRRRVRKWLMLTRTGELGEYFAAGDDGARHAFARLYRVLDSLDSRSHVAFTLRHFEGYELTEVAEALSCSLATVKRVLSAVETRVWALAAQDPYLASYIDPKEPRS
jgi:RNA polymerase sigma-70 factor (ECF subfamily)